MRKLSEPYTVAGSATKIKMTRKPGKGQKEYPCRVRWGSNQREGNIGEEKRTVDSAKFEFCDVITKRRREEKRGKGKRGDQERF